MGYPLRHAAGGLADGRAGRSAGTAGGGEERSPLGEQGDALTFDPHPQNEGPPTSANSQMYEPLLQRNARIEKEPALAVSWRLVHPTTWEFKRRRGVKFPDGAAFRAEAGKSVTGAAIIGLLEPPCRIAGGEIHLDGRRIDALPPEAMRRVRGRRGAQGRDRQRRLGLTYLFISHNLAVVHRVSDRVGVMCLGRLAEVADPRTLFARPRHPYTRMLLDTTRIWRWPAASASPWAARCRTR